MATAPRIDYASFGTPGAPRTVALVRWGPVATTDPDPMTTARRDIRLITLAVKELGISDPEAYGGETPDEEHAQALATLLVEEGASLEQPMGLVGYGEAGWRAASAAAILGDAVDRLALVDVPRVEDPLGHSDAVEILGRIRAATLVIGARGESSVGEDDARWIAAACARPEVEIVDDTGRISLATVWGRVLDHTAPGVARR